jgi:two-component system CheB/CheR fusion protein
VKHDSAELRQRAEERLRRTRADGPRGAGSEDLRLAHELRVHQIELELQNEELRSSRAELEAALDRYTQLFDFAPVAYVLVAPDGRIRSANFAAARMLGKERGRLAGVRLSALLAPEDADCLHRLMSTAAAGSGREDAPESCEVKLERGQAGPGDARDVRITASELAGTAGPGVLLAIEDVTARRRAEQALRDESHHKDEFLATLSHELRNPLGPIRNGLYLLERLPPGCEQSQRAMGVVERQLGHLTRIVEDLLDVTRIARGKIRLARGPVELAELVRRTMDDHRGGFEERGVGLQGRLDGGPYWVDGDPTRLVQILGNLLGNAEKFTGRGGRVEVDLRREGAAVALAVRDDGIGIAPEVRDRLFEPFSQGPQALDRTRGGLGLGLSMVKGLVELHGGTIALASGGHGKGAEFTVRLPAILAPKAAQGETASHPAAHHSVLVIEDNDDAATSLKQVLELCGHDVRVAPDGPTGLALAHEQRPEIVICDIGLPGMDGYEVARALRADAAARDAFLIALTGYARPDDARRAAEAGFDRHLGKPPPLDKLETLLAEIPSRDGGGQPGA